jgi:hypothetical protein
LSTQAPISSEATVLAALVAWAEDCPAWQRDALRRLSTTPSLEEIDTAELLAVCKGEIECKPLESAHVRVVSVGNPVVTLRHIQGVQYVNALAVDEKLTFTRAGLTVVYGDNGSGKSGYARILKQVCRARIGNRSEIILPNIYDANPGTPAATIDFAVNGQNASSAWVLGQPADAALSAVSRVCHGKHIKRLQPYAPGRPQTGNIVGKALVFEPQRWLHVLPADPFQKLVALPQEVCG